MKKILLLGGGEFHDYRGCCEVMKQHLQELSSEYSTDLVISDLDVLIRPALDAYDILIFYWTKGSLTPEQKHGLLEWCAEKGRFIGIHCAATAFRDCPEYEALLGGRFRRHPPYREYYVTVEPSHPAMRYCGPWHGASHGAPARSITLRSAMMRRPVPRRSSNICSLPESDGSILRRRN